MCGFKFEDILEEIVGKAFWELGCSGGGGSGFSGEGDCRLGLLDVETDLRAVGALSGDEALSVDSRCFLSCLSRLVEVGVPCRFPIAATKVPKLVLRL